jgi:phospholipid/cholesterol/gamma-HCH transport system permease protein
MVNFIAHLGRASLYFCAQVGYAGLFLGQTVCRRPKLNQGLHLIVKQIYQLGVLSLLIILVSALFIGMVVALQGYYTLVKFAAEGQLGQLVALSVVRELAPVVTGLLFAGRAGSALTAELGLMRATEQINAMEMMAVDPFWRIIAPRFWAGIIAMPCLTILFDLVAIYGGQFVGVNWLGVNPGSFWGHMQEAVIFGPDIMNGVLKALCFGFLITWVAVFQGFYSAPNARGISQSTTKTVVYSSLLVLVFDFILTAVMMGGW